MLMGSMDENFSTLAVREGLSETEGCAAGGSVVILNGDVYVLSSNGPRRIRQGQIYESIHEPGGIDILRDVWSNVNRAQLQNALGWVDREEGHVGWMYATGSGTDRDTAIVFNTNNSSWSSFKFTDFNFTAIGSVEDTSGQEWVLFGDNDGLVYKYRVGLTQYDDNGTAIERIARSRLMGGEQAHVQKRMIEVQFQLYLDTDFEGEVRPYIDNVVGSGKRFGLYNVTGKKRYRRGFNHPGYRIGWELYSNTAAQTVTVGKAYTFSSVVGMWSDWAS
jgi:hypothetical protein